MKFASPWYFLDFAFDPPKFVDKITVEDRVSDSL